MAELPKEQYMCPVCGYGGLRQPSDIYPSRDPANSYGSNEVCPSCGYEFGVTDFVTTRYAYRHEWIAAGCAWHGSGLARPSGWDAVTQLADLITKTAPKVRSEDAKHAFDTVLERIGGPDAAVWTVGDLGGDGLASRQLWDTLWGDQETRSIDDAFAVAVKCADRILGRDDDRETRQALEVAAYDVGHETKNGEFWRAWSHALGCCLPTLVSTSSNEESRRDD